MYNATRYIPQFVPQNVPQTVPKTQKRPPYIVSISQNQHNIWGFWRRHPDLNRGIRVLQTHALPLGYGAKKIVR